MNHEPTTLDTYESICDYAREKSENLDSMRWQLGDLANLVASNYGDKTIETFARDIGQRKSTCYQYAQVSSFYTVEIRNQIRDTMPNVNYSMMRDAIRLKNIHKAIDWLNEVSLAGFSADEASRKLTETLGRETRDSIGGIIQGIESWHDEYIVKISISDMDMKLISTANSHVTIKLK